MGEVVRCAVTVDPLDVAAHLAAVASPGSGAIASFQGMVRDHDEGAEVRALEYQAHPSAGQVLAELARAAAARPGVAQVAVSHRVDAVLAIGEVAIVCAVSAAHRGEAFEACEQLIERVKHELPIWKRQTLADGTTDWVNCP